MKDHFLLQYDNMDDFFVPDLAFVYFCYIKYDYWAKQLCDWEFVDSFYYFWAFKIYYKNRDEELMKYYLNRYIMKTQFCVPGAFGKREYLSTMRKFIYSEIKEAIDHDDLDKAIFACNSVPKCFIFGYEMSFTLESTKLNNKYSNLVIDYMYKYLLKFPYKQNIAFVKRNSDNRDNEIVAFE